MVEVHGLALNEGRLRMITLPRGAELVETRNAIAPGFQMGNVFVMAGIPKVLQAMLEGVRPRLSASSPYRSLSLTANLPARPLSFPLRALQKRQPDVKNGIDR